MTQKFGMLRGIMEIKVMTVKLIDIKAFNRGSYIEVVVYWSNSRSHCVTINKDSSPWDVVRRVYQLLEMIRNDDKLLNEG